MDGPFVLTLFCARYIMECNLWEFGPRGGITLDSEGWLEAIRKFWEKIKVSKTGILWRATARIF